MSPLIRREIAAGGGWLGFERFMELALYAPGLGYYSRGDQQFGLMPRADGSGGDFVTAPEMSPLFGRALARQVAQALRDTGTSEVWEFGAGTGALAAQLLTTLDELGCAPERYTIVDLSGSLRERQARTVAERAPALAGRLRWVSELPAAVEGVVVGNEVLDAMPVALLHWDGEHWFERGVTVGADGSFAWADRPTELRLPVEGPFVPGTVTELPRIAAGFIRTLAQRLRRGAAFFIDYGFPEHEFYHPQRTGGTLMCHRGHQADADPLVAVGLKDLTAHVDFTAMALAAQDAGLPVLGYTSQARFLFNCGLMDDLQVADLRERAMAMKLVTEHEMGELFKVLALGAPGSDFEPIGFAQGDRCHTL
ncbi:class I SAM-dependent methyltransferase [Sphaerotilus microaerophilus]|uniref:class I SAM-dependent methyltransferase n=1 Tax=Sphaerotilus microaerophilus TaxID=2914710 RepID=UPI003D1636A9